jgi:hypothetical protein
MRHPNVDEEKYFSSLESLVPKNVSKQAVDFPVRQRMNTLPIEPKSSSKHKDYAYPIAAAVAALFLLLTWITA